MQIFENIFELIGKTPLLKLNNFKDEYHLYTNVYAKLEMYNPGGSIKDRAAYQIIKDALENNLINKETTIVEPTSGNTGIGLALIASVLKMKLILLQEIENQNMSNSKSLQSNPFLWSQKTLWMMMV